ncbi:MAG: DUF6395 domain-containing protein [Acidimicrobiaceae bacterium]|nr:DUF6395 domain-containing protein [Acidimicrobiaceae bacterium]
MRFEFEADSRRTVLRAIFEDGDSSEGQRQEGVGQKIEYSGSDVVFEHPVESIHPDLLGLLCLIIFYPFIGRRVTFPTAVSPRLAQAFEPENFETRLEFTNVDDSIDEYSGSRMALSFGGGIDSTAVRKMFPEAFIVHEEHLVQDRLVLSRSADMVRRMGAEKGRVVTTNQRYVSVPGGWHGWTCAAATSLLLATDFDLGIILTGSNLGSTLLWNGSAYYDRFAARAHNGITGNHWQSAFNAVGIPMFSPVCGASELLTMMLSIEALRAGEVVYCMADRGGACSRCLKCFRRDVIRAAVDSDHSPDWAPYDRTQVHAHLEKRPLYFGHVYSYVRDRHPACLPRFVRSRLGGLPDIRSDWPMRVNARTFEMCAEEWRETVCERVLRHLDPMEPDDVGELQAWDQNRPKAREPAFAAARRGAAREFRRLRGSRRRPGRILRAPRRPA